MTASGNGRPAYDAEAERGLLGSLFTLPIAWDTPEVRELRLDHFDDDQHRAIYAAMLNIRGRGEPPSPSSASGGIGSS